TTAAVTRWARRRRSLAVSISHMGFTLGAAVIPPLLALGVATVGSRVTVLILGVGLCGIVVPISRYLRSAPSSTDPRSDRSMPRVILGAGWLGDRVNKGKLAALASVPRALAWITLGLWPSFDVAQMMLVLLLLAPGESIWALTFALQADLFGTQNYATLRGIS